MQKTKQKVGEHFEKLVTIITVRIQFLQSTIDVFIGWLGD